MRKFTLIKRHLCILLLLTTFIFSTSCKKDKNLSQNDVNAIKEWYDAFTNKKQQDFSIFNDRNSVALKSATFGDKQFEGDWAKAVNYQTNDSSIVEVPIKSKGKFGFKLQNQKLDEINGEGNARLLFIKTPKVISAYFMILIADKPDKNVLSKTTFSKKDENFTGIIFYFTLAGEFVIGEKCVNGKVVRHTYPKRKLKTTSKTPVIKTEALYDCTYTVVEYWYQDCYYDSVSGNLQYCDPKVYYAVTVSQECTLVEPGPGGGSDPEPDPCGGETGPITVSVVAPGDQPCDTDPTPVCDTESVKAAYAGNPVSEAVSEVTNSETATVREKLYTWRIFKGTNYSFNSTEKGVHLKTGNGWVWQSLEHQNITKTGAFFGMSIECNIGGAASNIITPKNARMQLSYGISYSLITESCPIGWSEDGKTSTRDFAILD